MVIRAYGRECSRQRVIFLVGLPSGLGTSAFDRIFSGPRFHHAMMHDGEYLISVE